VGWCRVEWLRVGLLPGGAPPSGAAPSGVALSGVAPGGAALSGVATSGVALSGVASIGVAPGGVSSARCSRHAGRRMAGSSGVALRGVGLTGAVPSCMSSARCADHVGLLLVGFRVGPAELRINHMLRWAAELGRVLLESLRSRGSFMFGSGALGAVFKFRWPRGSRARVAVASGELDARLCGSRGVCVIFAHVQFRPVERRRLEPCSPGATGT
jgi:hypothetical protein